LFGSNIRFNELISIRIFAATALAIVLITASLGSAAWSQEKDKKKPEASEPAKKQQTSDPTRKDDTKIPSEKEIEKNRKQLEKEKPSQAESIVEVTLFAYGGRKQLETARGAIQEEGTIKLTTDQGDITGNFRLRSMRKEKSWQDLLRVDLELEPPDAAQRSGNTAQIKYVIGFNGATVWSAQNGQYIAPQPAAEAAFRAQLTHEYMTLLRYKEDGSKLEYVGPETVVGVPAFVIDLTTANGEKTRYWISSKFYRVIRCEYQLQIGDSPQPVKYRVLYYYTPFKVVQNTLVPIRRVMEQDGKQVQEVIVNQATYSAKFDPEIFQHLQE
jgi:hypothetical protein